LGENMRKREERDQDRVELCNTAVLFKILSYVGSILSYHIIYES